MHQSVSHDELDAALKRCGANCSAGQAHGLLCSRLAIMGPDAGLAWLDQVLEGCDADSAIHDECVSMLDTLYACTHRQLADRQSEFEPLLPQDSDSTIIRAEAIACWCEGFLHGLVSGAANDSLQARLTSQPLSDIVGDMLQITRATVDDESDDEDNETAYAELVEYLRVAVQLTYEELAEVRSVHGDEALH